MLQPGPLLPVAEGRRFDSARSSCLTPQLVNPRKRRAWQLLPTLSEVSINPADYGTCLETQHQLQLPMDCITTQLTAFNLYLSRVALLSSMLTQQAAGAALAPLLWACLPGMGAVHWLSRISTGT